jgi:hypothetical protein
VDGVHTDRESSIRQTPRTATTVIAAALTGVRYWNGLVVAAAEVLPTLTYCALTPSMAFASRPYVNGSVVFST